MLKKYSLILILLCINFSTYCAESKEAKEPKEDQERAAQELEKKEKVQFINFRNDYPSVFIIETEGNRLELKINEKIQIPFNNKPISLRVLLAKFRKGWPDISDEGKFRGQNVIGKTVVAKDKAGRVAIVIE